MTEVCAERRGRRRKYRVCPVCGREYTEPPALSRRDSETEICPECGTSEALDDAKIMIGAGMDEREWAKLKAEIIEKTRRIT